MRLRISIFLLFFLVGCGGSSSNNENGSDEVLLTINVTNFPSDIKSYKPVNISITANYSCSFILESDDIYWISTNDNKNFSYRAPITLLNEEEFDVQISSIQTASCPQGSLNLTHTVTRDEENLKYVPSPTPYNHSTLQTDYFASHNLGFGAVSYTHLTLPTKA